MIRLLQVLIICKKVTFSNIKYLRGNIIHDFTHTKYNNSQRSDSVFSIYPVEYKLPASGATHYSTTATTCRFCTYFLHLLQEIYQFSLHTAADSVCSENTRRNKITFVFGFGQVHSCRLLTTIPLPRQPIL